MAQFDFAGTWDDSWRLLDAVLAPRDLSLIPDMAFATPEPVFFTALDDSLKAILRERRRVFLWSSKWCRFPASLAPHPAKELAGTYYVRFDVGGPLLVVLDAAEAVKEWDTGDNKWLKTGVPFHEWIENLFREGDQLLAELASPAE